MKKYYILFILLMLNFTQFKAQQLEWKNAGPDNIGSKTRSIVVDGNRVYAGSTGAGLWYSENGGVAWKREEKYANQKCNPTISCMVKNQSNNTWYIGTGEVGLTYGSRQSNSTYNYENDSTGFFGYIGNPGAGIYTSKDNAAWTNENASTLGIFGSRTSKNEGPFAGINKILIHSSGRMYIATHQGLFYSDDNLQSVDTVLTKLDTTILQKVYKMTPAPIQPKWPQTFGTSAIFDIEEGKDGVVYATAFAVNKWDNTRISWFLRVVEKGNLNQGKPLFLAADSIKLGGVLTKFGRGGRRAELAVAPSDNSYLYIAGLSGLGEVSGVWRSRDKGNSWEIAGPQGNPGFTPLALQNNNYYTFVMQIDPTNPRNIILAGNSWYSYTDDRGWTQTGQSSNPNTNNYNYVPNAVYCIAYDPNKTGVYYVGTEKQIVKYSTESDPRIHKEITGFRQRTKGYEGALCVSVSAMGVIKDDKTEPDSPVYEEFDAVYTGTSNNGILCNKFYAKEGYYAQQGHGKINANNWSDVGISYLYPYNMVVQRNDQGIELSTNNGVSYSAFYSSARQVNKIYGLSKKDSLIDRDIPVPDKDFPRKGILTNRNPVIDGYNRPNTTPFVIDEYIPDSMLDKGKDALHSIKSRIFFCSGSYLWVVNNPFIDSVKWNRITNELVTGLNVITAIAVSGDDQHTVYIGTSNGLLYKILRPDNLMKFNVIPDTITGDSNIVKLHLVASGLPKGRWISSISVDPNDTKRLVVTYAAFGKWSSLDKSKLVCMTNDITVANPIFEGIAGKLFTNASATQAPAPVFCSKIVYSPITKSSILLVGTGKGLFSSSDWENFYPENETEIGNVAVTDIYVRKYIATISDITKREFSLKKDNTIYISTYGRGIFYTSNLRYKKTQQEEEKDILSEENMQIYPNPCKNVVHLEMNCEEGTMADIALWTIEGKVLSKQEALSLAAGKSTLDFNTEKLSPGIYFLQVKTINKNHIDEKMLKFIVGH